MLVIYVDFPGVSDGKESACNVGDSGPVPGSETYRGGGSGYPRQCSCLENFMDRGDRWATVHGVVELVTSQLLVTSQWLTLQLFSCIRRKHKKIYRQIIRLNKSSEKFLIKQNSTDFYRSWINILNKEFLKTDTISTTALKRVCMLSRVRPFVTPWTGSPPDSAVYGVF